MKAKTFVVAVLGVAAGLGSGIGLERGLLARPTSSLQAAPPPAAQSGPRILYWWDPMIPDYKSDKPGKSPMGMDMVPVYEGQEPGRGTDPGVVTVSAAAAGNFGVRTAAVERTTLSPAIETFGTVAFDESRTAHLHVRAKGWIEKLHSRIVGDSVQQGQLLFEFFSQDLAVAAAEYVRELQRGGEATEVFRRKLRALGVSERQIDEIRTTRTIPERIRVYAPQSGVVVALGAAEGMFIEPETTILSITDIASIWLIAEVFESQGALVAQGMPAEVRLPSRPGRVWHGTVDYVYPDLKPDTRTVRLRIRLDNADRTLQPNMFANVRLGTKTATGVLAVPSSALIRTGQGERAVLALGDGRFRPVTVTAGLIAGDKVEVRDGLKEGDRVVTSAHFLIDSESSLAAGFARMEEAPPERHTGEGDITELGDRSLTLSHGPVPSIGWPAMTMIFALDDGVSAAGLALGQRVAFDFVPAAGGGYRIVAVRPAGGGR